MTCIVGYVKGGDVYMGADSFVGGEWSRYQTAEPKVRVLAVPGLRHPVLVAVTGLLRIKTILDHMSMPAMIADQRRWVDEIFIDALRQAMWAAGYIKWEDGQEQMPEPNVLLMGFGGHLYSIENNFQVLQVAQPYLAEGAGMFHAEGAMAAMESIKPVIAPKRRVELALRAAAAHSPYVAPPYAIFRTG